jgi:hypothetical protein
MTYSAAQGEAINHDEIAFQKAAWEAKCLYGPIGAGWQVPPYRTFMDGDQAVMRQDHTPTTYSETRIFHREGVWHVAGVAQRPSREDEGYGLTVRQTTTYPLASDGHVSVEYRLGTLSNDGQLTDRERLEQVSPEPIDPMVRMNLTASLVDLGQRLVAPAPPRAPRTGWLRWLPMFGRSQSA